MADPYDTPGYRYSVNEFPGDGVTINWNIQFAGRSPGYISIDHVRASIIDEDGVETPILLSQSNFVQPTLLRIEPAVPAGSVLRVWRDTPKDEPLLDYNDGALMTERNLDTSFDQAVYAAAEMVDRAADSLEDVEEFSQAVLDRLAEVEDVADDAAADAAAAVSTANTALSTANAAVVTANDALAGVTGAEEAAILATAAANAANAAASAATTAAADAEQAALDATSTAASALSVAENAETVANGIAGTAAAALAAAENAETVANGIAATANAALDTANDAAADALEALNVAQGIEGTAQEALDTVNAALANLEWLAKPIGEPFPLWAHIPGCPTPPTDDPRFRYIKLTASDSYNTGVLTNESVSGSAPLINATAVIDYPDSPLHGQTVRLINTERRFLRAGDAGVVQDSANLAHTHTADSAGSHTHSASSGSAGAHTHSVSGTAASAGAHTHTVQRVTAEGALNTALRLQAGNNPTTMSTSSAGAHTHSVSGTAASAGAHSHSVSVSSAGAHTHTISDSGTTESRPRNIGADYYMRIK